MYAAVIVDISSGNLDRTYEYNIPEALSDMAVIGAAVTIPFGNGNRTIPGYIVGLNERCSFDSSKIKNLISVDNKQMIIESRLIALAYWIKEQFGATMNDCLKTVIPVKKKVRELQKRRIIPACDTEILTEAYNSAIRKGYKAKERVLYELLDSGELDYELITKKLNISPATINKLAADGMVRITSVINYRSPIKQDQAIWHNVQLNKRQKQIADEIINDIRNGYNKNYLLHGVTGSGKTEVYMEIIDAVVTAGKQVIMLIPEIALTYQTVKRFYKRFGDRISVINSKLSDGERYDQCMRAKRGETDIMIGPRSALFTPFDRVGLIIIDEEHESSYKNEGVPRYHAREVAIKRAEIEGASVILGSATPSLESYSAALKGSLKLFTLTERAASAKMPVVDIIDMKQELVNKNRSMFSNKLRELIEDRLKKKEQIMLFLNRRGYSGFVSCRSCGHVIKCPHCDISLTLHKNKTMVCHYCGYTASEYKLCPSCGSKYIGSFGVGTQKVEEILKKDYPDARILRMDADTTKNKAGHEEILSSFANCEADILVGTQMIVKGHDFHNVTLVGILLADMSLYASDYRSAERTYQLLSQAAGRAGRGELTGEVVIQTYNPENYSIIKAAENDYQGFYNEEIAFRRLMKYPPESNLLLILFMSKHEDRALAAGELIKSNVLSYINSERGYKMLGPAPAGVMKANDQYRYVMYIRNNEYSSLVYIKNHVSEYVLGNEAFSGCSIQFDFNPVNTY